MKSGSSHSATLTVVVTGAASGIGRSIAMAFGKKGARLHLTDLNEQDLTGLKSGLLSQGGAVFTYICDCRDAAAMSRFADSVFAIEGRVDVLCNNAGVGQGGPTEELTPEDWRLVIDTNLWGVIHGITSFLPHLLKQEGGAHIVNIASMSGLVALPGMAAYTASKYAVVGLSESLAAEYAHHKIRVSAICPGFIRTNVIRNGRINLTGILDTRRTQAFYDRFGATPDRVAREVLRAVRSRKVVRLSAPGPALLLWMVKRVSARLYEFVIRQFSRVLLGGTR